MTVEAMRAKAAELREQIKRVVYPTTMDDILVTQLEFIAELCHRLEKE